MIRVDQDPIAFENGTGDLDNPQVAVDLTDNSFIVTYEDVSGHNEKVSARIVNSSGALGAEFDAAQNSTNFDRLGDTAILTAGNFIVVYEEENLGMTGIEFKISTPSGGTATPAVNVESGSDPQVASLANGGFVVTYTDGGDVFARFYSNTGVAIGQNPINVAIGTNEQNKAEVVGCQIAISWSFGTMIHSTKCARDGSIATVPPMALPSLQTIP